MLDKSDIESLVLLIDDLDRCLPERIIETLEAIKLFVLVPRTAFVIGADPCIGRHAIGTRYVKQQIGEDDSTRQEEYDLIKDYLKKLIQIPYHLPRLSPAEVETYVNLLACQKFLREEGDYRRVLEDCLRTCVTGEGNARVGAGGGAGRRGLRRGGAREPVEAGEARGDGED